MDEAREQLWEKCLRDLHDEIAALRRDPRMQIPLDGPGSHRQDLIELRKLQTEIESLKISNRWLSEESAGFEKRWKAAQEHAAKLQTEVDELKTRLFDQADTIRRQREQLDNTIAEREHEKRRADDYGSQLIKLGGF